MRLRVVILVYLALFVGELSWSGVTPLIPAYIDRYTLTDFAGGLVLSVASLGILVASLPASMVTKRISPRTLTLSAIAVIAIADLVVAAAPGYLTMVLARLVFGLGFGVLWVAMAAWLDDAAGDRSAQVLALTTAVVGVSAMLAPALTGWVAQSYGLDAPFLWLAIISAVLFLLLLADRSGTGLRKDPAPPLRELAKATRADPDLLTMLLLTTAAALLWMTADLLVPLRLDDAGFSTAQIGFAFSISSLMFVTASAVTARGADRWTRPRIAATATAGLAFFTALPAIWLGVPVTIVFLMGAGVCTGISIALTFPFGLLSVERGVVTVAAMSALANVIWALSGMFGPTVGGAVAEWVGDRMAFAVLAAVCASVAIVIVRLARKTPAA